jgi:hypothetical protein
MSIGPDIQSTGSFPFTLMFTPGAITQRKVVNPGQKLKFIQRHLLRMDPKLLFKLPLRCAPGTLDGGLNIHPSLSGNVQRIQAGYIRPHINKGVLLRGTLLNKKTKKAQ